MRHHTRQRGPAESRREGRPAKSHMKGRSHGTIRNSLGPDGGSARPYMAAAFPPHHPDARELASERPCMVSR